MAEHAEHAEHGGNPKMFAEAPKLDGATPWQKFESLARTVFSVRKDEIDANKPVRPGKRAMEKKRAKKA
jgi:hypothetical protein